MAATSNRTKKPRKPLKGLEGVPQLVTHRLVADKFGVTPACIRKWVRNREFPAPHAVINRTWFYKADVIEHKLRTGNWLEGVRFVGDRGALAP